MAALTVSELLQRNEIVASKHQPLPTLAQLAEMKMELSHIVIITCADPRCLPEYFLDLKPSDGVVIMRNVAGHVKPLLDGIVALDSFIGITDILVVHHTDCGASHFKDEKIRSDLKARLPKDGEVIDHMYFGAFSDFEQSVRDDLNILKESKFIRKELAERSVGFIYDLETGKLNEVKA